MSEFKKGQKFKDKTGELLANVSKNISDNMTYSEPYAMLDEMHEGLGQVARMYTVTYHLPGELKESEVSGRPIKADSAYGQGLKEPICIDGNKGWLFERSDFHGVGPVFVTGVYQKFG